MISPQQLHDTPKLWLTVDHKMHEVLGKLMTQIFPDWPSKLSEFGVHCLECDGHKPVPVIVKNTQQLKLCIGWVEKPVKELRIVDLTDEVLKESKKVIDGGEGKKEVQSP